MIWIGLRFGARQLREVLRFLRVQLKAAYFQDTDKLACWVGLALFVTGFVFVSSVVAGVISPSEFPVTGSVLAAMVYGIIALMITFPAKFVEYRNWRADVLGAAMGAGPAMWGATQLPLSFTTYQDYPVQVMICGLFGALIGMNMIVRPLAGGYHRIGGARRVGRAITHLVWM